MAEEQINSIHIPLSAAHHFYERSAKLENRMIRCFKDQTIATLANYYHCRSVKHA